MGVRKAWWCAAVVALVGGVAPVLAEESELTIVHSGDFHGHLIPRANVRSDSVGRSEGGLARVATVLEMIRRNSKNVLYVHTGDTLQGGAEVLYTRGQAIVDILDLPEFSIDAFAPGNWDFVYGTQRFVELFAADDAGESRWGAVAANVFYATAAGPCVNRQGERPLRPYRIKQMGGIKIGILGLTTDRGPQVVGSAVTQGLCFLKNGDDEFTTDAQTGLVTQTVGGVDSEVAEQVAKLRNDEGVQLVILASEMGLANNIRLAEKIDGIDIVLSSDMHEETTREVVAVNAISGRNTVVVEEGQDGTMLGKLDLRLEDGRLRSWQWRAIRVDSDYLDNGKVAAKVAEIRRQFTAEGYAEWVNPFNGSHLKRPIDAVVGEAAVALHRSNYSQGRMPAVIEGSSHDFLTDAFRAGTGADIAAIRGFRFGTHVPVGPIKYEDLFHFMPIGAQIAVARLPGQAIKNQIENSASGSLNPDVAKWTGGWLFNFSGITMDLDPYAAPVGSAPFALADGRAFNIRVNGEALALKQADGVTNQTYRYASYWFATDPCKVNTIDVPNCTSNDGAPSNITILRDSDGGPLDATEVVVNYLAANGGIANPVLNRITLRSKDSGRRVRLPEAAFGNAEIQPLRGAVAAPAPRRDDILPPDSTDATGSDTSSDTGSAGSSRRRGGGSTDDAASARKGGGGFDAWELVLLLCALSSARWRRARRRG